MARVDAGDKGSGALDLHVAAADCESIVSRCDGLMDQRDAVGRDALHRELSAPDRGEEGCAVNESKEAGGARQDDSAELSTVRISYGVLRGEHLGGWGNVGGRGPGLGARGGEAPVSEFVPLFPRFLPEGGGA